MMEIHSIAPCDSVGQAFPIRSSIIIDNKDYRIDSLIDNLDMFEEEVACLLSNMRNSPSITSQFTVASPSATRKRRYVSSSDDDEYSDEVDGSFENVDDCYDEEFGGEEDDWSETRAASNSSPNGSRSRGNRRKAASGTACEKHKRWKKRCPDDCPMRRGKIQKTSLAVVASSVPRSPSTPIIHSAQPSSSLLTMIRWSSENRSNVTIDDLRELENQITEMRTPSPDSEDNSASDDVADFMEEKRKTSPIKSEETQLKAPQPRRRFRVSKLLDEEEEFSQDSAYTPRTQKKLRVSTKRTSGRKYLPSACERHKLLHAKCPANCPERLKRDADMAASKRAEDIPFLPL